MKIAFVSSLYPNEVEPGLAPYNRQLVAALAGQASVRVMAPVFWFPGLARLRKRPLPPVSGSMDGVPVTYPRVFYTPGIMIQHHWLTYRFTVASPLKQLFAAWRPDLVIASFIYPDAAAVVSLCNDAGIPCAAMVLGSDFRIRTTQPRFRDVVMRTLCAASAVICPGQALKRDMAAAGIPDDKIIAFDNGVDHSLFRVRPKEDALKTLESEGGGKVAEVVARLRAGARCVLYVGHLKTVKGADRMVNLWRQWSGEDAILVMAGHGDLLPVLRQMAESAGIGGKICFLGDRPHREIPCWMNAADCLCLPSRSEGMPNVVVEALASGLPVVATDVGEVPFLIKPEVHGMVCAQGGGEQALLQSMARGIRYVLERQWDRAQLAAAVQEMTWERAAGTLLNGFESLGMFTR